MKPIVLDRNSEADESKLEVKPEKKEKKKNIAFTARRNNKKKMTKNISKGTNSVSGDSKIDGQTPASNEVKLLDLELNLLDEHQESEDEERFDFSYNSHYFLKKAFCINEDYNYWKNEFEKVIKHHNIFEEQNTFLEIQKFIRSKRLESKAYFKYSLNPIEDFGETISIESSYFTKFIILLNLLFEISYIYQYQFDLGYKKVLVTVYDILVLNFTKLNSTSSLFLIPELSVQILYFSIVGFWLTCVIIFMIMNNRYEVERKVVNFQLIYCMKKKEIQEDGTEKPYVASSAENTFFTLILILVTYLYIPIIRDSISTVFFIIDQYEAKDSFEMFFKVDSTNGYRWSVFLLSCLMFIACIVLPIYFYRLLNNNFPLLDPFDPNNDTTFHSLNCPDSCSGALLDIDKRMCWDFIKDNVFIVDVERPISMFEFDKKEKRVMKKYYYTCNSYATPLLIFFQGYSYYFRFSLFWVYIKQYIFLIMIKLPYSKFFEDFKENDMVNRSLISFSLGIAMCLFQFCESVKNFKKKYNFLHDTILELIVRLLVLVISVMSLVKVAIAGNYIFVNSEKNKSLLTSCESKLFSRKFLVVSFVCLCLCVVILIIFIIISSPAIQSKFTKKHFKFNTSIFKYYSQEMKIYLLEKMWKPFWDNLFKNDIKILSKEIVIDKDFIEEHLIGNEPSKEVLEMIVKKPALRMKQLKKKIVKYDDDLFLIPDHERFEKISKCDILIRKWLQHKLEGVDVYWDGDVVGKRTCLNFWGRVIIIYDESNEKVEIPQDEFITLCKMNLQNQEILRQKDIRKKLRSLNKQNIEYDEYYYEKRKSNEGLEEASLLLFQKKRSKNMEKGEQKNDKPNKHVSQFLNLFADKKREVKHGVLRVETIIPDKQFCHGLNIFLEIKDKKNQEITLDTIKFDSKEVTINARNFKFTKLNVLLEMNQSKINEETIENFEKEKQKYREEVTFKRYLDEITLSSHFVDMVYDNCEVTLHEIFKYFAYFEKRKEMKIFPHLHLKGLIFISYLWTLCSRNAIQALWYCFFYDVWVSNRKTIENLNLGKFFDPDNSLSICYYAMEREKLENFLNKLEIYNYFPDKVLKDFYKKIEDLKKEIENDFKEKAKNLEKINSNKKENQNKGMYEEEKMNTEEINKIMMKSHDFRDKFSQEINDFSPLMYVTPTWLYCTIKDDNELKKIDVNKAKEDEQGSKNLSENDEKKDDAQLEFSSKRDLKSIRVDMLSSKNSHREKLDKAGLKERWKKLKKDTKATDDKKIMPFNKLNEMTFVNDHENEPKKENNQHTLDQVLEIKNKFFNEKNKNTDKLFNQLGEKLSTVLALYSDDEVFDLYMNRDFRVEESCLADVTADNILIKSDFKGHMKRAIHRHNHHVNERQIGDLHMPEVSFKDKNIELTLPPIFKYIDLYKKFEGEKFFENMGFIQKCDQKGRVFYVDQKHEKTTFRHPLVKKKEMKKEQIGEEEIQRRLKLSQEGWETMYYKNEETGNVKVLYVNPKTKQTSWNPTKNDKKLSALNK